MLVSLLRRAVTHHNSSITLLSSHDAASIRTARAINYVHVFLIDFLLLGVFIGVRVLGWVILVDLLLRSAPLGGGWLTIGVCMVKAPLVSLDFCLGWGPCVRHRHVVGTRSSISDW